LVATPGRILKLLRENEIDTDSIKTFVLDEADKMLDMGFHTDIMNIERFIPLERQTLLFSATFPESIADLGKKIQDSPVDIRIDSGNAPDTIEQTLFKVKSHTDKPEALLKILGLAQPERSIVFCKTKQISDEVARFLNKNSIVASAIHGDLDQNERTVTLTRFSNRSLSVLVATDVAARGLDIKELEAVINYDLPSDPEVYIHRVGRTGRAGLSGKAYGLYIDKEFYKIEAIEELLGEQVPLKDIVKLRDLEFKELPPMETMYIGGGKKDKVRPGDVLGALVKEAGLSPDTVGNISVLNILTYVAIKREFIDQAINKLSNGKIKNRKFKVGRA
ncbi:MAG: DbpA RNA binding domain-containing protein, partial [Bacteriovoracaceae bacterium]|nr:DbpA RNA binding domain-containing protein [Bacteriovoracaceae bacterium]